MAEHLEQSQRNTQIPPVQTLAVVGDARTGQESEFVAAMGRIEESAQENMTQIGNIRTNEVE